MSGPDAFGSNPYAANSPVHGQLVTILRGITDRRGLKLEAFRSRAVQAGEVHELMTTDQVNPQPGDSVDAVALLGFFEVVHSGVILVGSEVKSGNLSVGIVAGFDQTHMPNHQNICLSVPELRDGVDLELKLGDRLTIERVEQ